MRLYKMSDHSNFTVTQEVLAEMVGSRRNSVSLAAHTMQEANVIRYSRGLVEMADYDALQRYGEGDVGGNKEMIRRSRNIFRRGY